MTETTKTKKQLIIFLLVAYGVTYLMGLLAWYGNTKAYDLSNDADVCSGSSAA